MRTASAIGLLLCLLFSTVGVMAVFTWQQYQIRREVRARLRAGLPAEELVLLKITRQQERAQEPQIFQRVDEAEFRYRGHMYDVVRQETHADTTWYYCLPDSEESALYARLEKLTDQQTGHQPERQQQRELVKKILSGLYFTDYSLSWAGSFSSHCSWPTAAAVPLPHRQLHPPTPPPQSFIS